ncbi:conjugal transfer protein [Levilactobacillus zymae]|uniref:conjugal transfer protein n=1 Tax=Levilactobacillus zymae TaxID=267363 RepID=UPI0028B78F26|nr:conjugal transfer protein [Levilactobacillus zymae]MDT6981768.1 conjugal transfer protein [Levilactobacillus zymae]
MKDKLLNSVKVSWPYLLTLIIGLYLAEILAGSVMALSHYKLTFANHMPTVLKQLALHPWRYYNLYLGQKNPVLIIVSIAVVLYTVYFALKRNSKHKAWETADTETHGSATWGNLKDLSDHYFSINAKDLTTAFNRSTTTEILEALTKQETQSKTGK